MISDEIPSSPSHNAAIGRAGHTRSVLRPWAYRTNTSGQRLEHVYTHTHASQPAWFDSVLLLLHSDASRHSLISCAAACINASSSSSRSSRCSVVCLRITAKSLETRYMSLWLYNSILDSQTKLPARVHEFRYALHASQIKIRQLREKLQYRARV